MERTHAIKEIQLLEEKRRRILLSKSPYKPNAGQALVHFSNKSERFVFSGNGAGKTCILVQEMLAGAKGYNPWLKEYTKVPAKIVVILDSPEKVQKKIIPEIKKWYPLQRGQLYKDGKPYYSRISFPNAEVEFMFHDQDIMKFESVEVDLVLCDEPPPRHIYIGLFKRGGRELGSNPRLVVVATPLAGPWLRKEIYEPWARGHKPKIECFKFHTSVNERNLRKGYIEDLEEALTEKEKRTRLHGDFFDTDGLALAYLFDRSVHLINPPPWPPNWPCVVAIDPHGSKPHYASLVGVDPEGYFYYLKEIASTGTPIDFAYELRDFYKGYNVVDIVCDSLGSGLRTGGDGNKSFIQVMIDHGVQARPTTFSDKNDEAWINKIQDILRIPNKPDNFGRRIPKLAINYNCRGIISDIETVEWLKYKNIEMLKPKLNITDKDFLATLKYALAANLSYQPMYKPVKSNGNMNFTKRWRGYVRAG